jgi:uncharacterized CHY-type Zn-finger protein
MTKAFRFWKRVRDFAFKKMKETANGYSACWKCSNYDFDKPWVTWRTTDHPMIDEAVCGNCGHVNRWRMDGMVPVHMDGPHGQPF